MAEDPRTPVAIRISRPFASEEEFLAHELDTLTRTTVMLVGAQSRPQGVVLRFEVALANGDPLIRGEGRVVAFRAASQGVDSGLTLRFTRLDARSKALVDRAAAMRESQSRARASMHPPRPAAEPAAPEIPKPPPPPRPPPSEPTRLFSDEPTRVVSLQGSQPSQEESTRVVLPPVDDDDRDERTVAFAPIPTASAERLVPAARARPAAVPPPPSSGSVAIAGARREELLDRLRQRAKALSPAAVETLLASRVRRA